MILSRVLKGHWIVSVLVSVLILGSLGLLDVNAQLSGGDIIIADADAFAGLGGIIKVDPTTGAQTTISSGGLFVDPIDVAITASGDLIVVDFDAFGGTGHVFRVDPITGAQSLLSTGGSFVDPAGVAIAPHIAVGGTVLPIDTTALLVAGAQTISPWLILGVLSAVGIGLTVFTLKRR